MHQFKEYLVTAAAFVLTFLSPIAGIMILVGSAIMIDTMTGIWKSRKLKRKITSRGLQSLVAKMFFYQGVIIFLFMLDKFIMNDVMALIWDKIPFAITKTVALVLCWIELLSINENYQEVRGISIMAKVKSFLGMVKKVKDGISDFKGEGSEKDSSERDSAE
jgi:hypothetical protein